jgi:hypothetical protein
VIIQENKVLLDLLIIPFSIPVEGDEQEAYN